jgi:hypothetical protein
MSQNPAKRRCLDTETKKFVDFCNFVCKFSHQLASISETLSSVSRPGAAGGWREPGGEGDRDLANHMENHSLLENCL